jgi:hypothetical protein
MSYFTLLDAVAGTTVGAGSTVPFQNVKGAMVQVFSAAGSSATVKIQGSFDGTVWFDLATVTNPSASGEIWKGTATDFMRGYTTAHASGTITMFAKPLDTDPGSWVPVVGTGVSSAQSYGLLKYQYTNAQIVAAGAGVGPLNVNIGAVPAKSTILTTHLIVDTQGVLSAGTLTGSVGSVGTDYVDLILASSLKAAAATIYGDAANEKGATNVGSLYSATAKTLYLQVVAGAGNLADVTAATGTIYIEYVTLP